MQMEIMSTNFVDTCITHGGDLASKKHFSEICNAMKDIIIFYNCATIVQGAGARWLLRKKIKQKQLKNSMHLWAKVVLRKTGRDMCHTPMTIRAQTKDDGRCKKCWELIGEPENVWDLMCSMSKLISHQGKHSDYYLNESKAFRLFWVCITLYDFIFYFLSILIFLLCNTTRF